MSEKIRPNCPECGNKMYQPAELGGRWACNWCDYVAGPNEVNEPANENRTPKADQVRPKLKYYPDEHYWCIKAPDGYVLRKVVVDWDCNETRTVINFEVVSEAEAEADEARLGYGVDG